ncbi:hypothetical protein EV426DRAFT_298676 [Tirmania nivea]|nr:hypothetical protein EV426DRAFT_298676 [Tirmania nivea]
MFVLESAEALTVHCNLGTAFAARIGRANCSHSHPLTRCACRLYALIISEAQALWYDDMHRQHRRTIRPVELALTLTRSRLWRYKMFRCSNVSDMYMHHIYVSKGTFSRGATVRLDSYGCQISPHSPNENRQARRPNPSVTNQFGGNCDGIIGFVHRPPLPYEKHTSCTAVEKQQRNWVPVLVTFKIYSCSGFPLHQNLISLGIRPFA